MHSRLRPSSFWVVGTAAAIAGGVCLTALPASAGTSGTGGGSADNGTITATAASGAPGAAGTAAGGRPLSGGPAGNVPQPPPACTYLPAPAGAASYLGPGEGGPGTWYVVSCASRPTPQAIAFPVIWVPTPTPGATGPTVVSAASAVPGLVNQALDRAALVQPTIQIDPPAGAKQVVFVPTWLWIPPSDWRPVVASAAAGDVRATVTAVPTSVSWSFGDGQQLACPGPGVPYVVGQPDWAQSTYCSHMWTSSSAGAPGGVFTIRASIEYRVTVAVTGALDAVPDLGLHAGPAAQTEVVVSEVEALGTEGNGGR